MTQPATSPVDELAQRFLDHLLAADPLEATLYGFRQHDAELADLSAAHDEILAEERAAIRTAAQALDPASLSQQEAITRSVIITLTEYGDAIQSAAAIEYTVASLAVTPSSVLIAYLPMIVPTNEDQAVAYLERLSQIPRYLQQAEERLRAGRRESLLPVARLVGNAIDQIDAFLAAEPCPFALAAPDGFDAADDWRARQAEIIDGEVKPAFAAYRDALRAEVLPTARPDDEPGLIYLPDGRARYEALARVHTTTDLSPERLHEIGLEIVARVHEEFAMLGPRVLGTDVPSEIFTRLKEDEALRWTTSDEILQEAETAVRRAEAAAGEWFGRTPEAVCAVKAIPPLEADGAPPAYYMPPAVDGSSPGTYYANVTQPGERTRYDLESVAYHEAVPGHHFQIALAMELTDLPLLRRMPLFTAYAEGWGLYSERLADEMGLYSSDLQRMGMLSADAWRATRLVVDTGLHALGWSRQRALDYMLDNTASAPIEAAAEVDRYIAMPGQALAYMMGRLEILELRARAESALGERFDVKAFHDTVLGSGGLPLSVLADLVGAWIAESSSA